MKKYFILFIIPFSLMGCFEKKTYLTDEIKSIVPYKEGQELTFESNSGLTNTLLITGIEDKRFPDGIGAPRNERLHVVAYRESKTFRSGTEKYIFSLAAKNKEEEEILFEFSLKETSMHLFSTKLTEFKNLKNQVLETEFYSFDDVVKIVLPPKIKKYDQTINEVFWSKSTGYVRLVQNDGTIWDLKKITYR